MEQVNVLPVLRFADVDRDHQLKSDLTVSSSVIIYFRHRTVFDIFVAAVILSRIALTVTVITRFDSHELTIFVDVDARLQTTSQLSRIPLPSIIRFLLQSFFILLCHDQLLVRCAS
jgi:hypothetical protein